MTDSYKDTLLEFPVTFPIKAMGRSEPGFSALVIEMIAAHAEFHPQDDVREQHSANGNFISVTVSFNAVSKEQLDTIYQALTDHDQVLMVF